MGRDCARGLVRNRGLAGVALDFPRSRAVMALCVDCWLGGASHGIAGVYLGCIRALFSLPTPIAVLVGVRRCSWRTNCFYWSADRAHDRSGVASGCWPRLWGGVSGWT